MKIQHLAIIFLLIILPIDIVLGLYIDAQINTIRNKALFDARLVNSVYDALEVYQSNSLVDTENDIVTSKMSNIEASASTFLTSLQTSFGYSGYKATVMQEYVPAVVYTMYDGYYIYSKFNNTVSQVNVNPYSTYSEAKDENGMGAKTIEGIKSYVFYSCRYKRNKNGKEDDFVITYSLDNYIAIQGIIQGEYVNDAGYLIDGIKCEAIDSSDTERDNPENYKYTYDSIVYMPGSTEKLTELVGTEMYPYTKINGTKYYYDNSGTEGNESDDKIFHIINGTKVFYPPYSNIPNSDFQRYKKAIENNRSAYLYYREAYHFTKRIRRDFSCRDINGGNIYGYSSSIGEIIEPKVINNKAFRGYGLRDLSTENIKDENLRKKSGKYNIFKEYCQDSDSNFNRHRSAVIRHSIETNLSAAIAGFSEFSDQLEFAMPKISETDWEMIENNVSVIGFLQGLDMGTKKYNGYAAVANTTTTEYVDEDAIYLLAGDGQYHRANATDLPDPNPTYYEGVFKIDFERHYIKKENDGTTINYYPKSPSSPSESSVYTASYSSIINQTAVNTEYDDMYKYMRSLDSSDKNKKIKTAYYTALARERFGSYKVGHDISYSYYLKYY